MKNEKYKLSISNVELRNIMLLHEECRRIHSAMQYSMKHMTGSEDMEVSYHFPTLGPNKELADPILLKHSITAYDSAYTIMVQCSQHLQLHLEPMILYALEHDLKDYKQYHGDLYTAGFKGIRMAVENFKPTSLNIDDYFYQNIVAHMHSVAIGLNEPS